MKQMKYYRKQPVEAIQWNGDNQKEVSEFVEKMSSVFCTQDTEDGKLTVGYLDSKQNNHIAYVPKFGWVVIEGKTLQFYKDETFRKTFKAAEEKCAERILLEPTLDKIEQQAQQTLDEAYIDVLEAMFGGCEKLFGKKPNKDVVDAIKEAAKMNKDLLNGFRGVSKDKIQEAIDEQEKMRKDPFFVPANFNACADNANKWLNDMTDKCIEHFRNQLNPTTFDSVLDEMKELHAKKNKDYGSAFHKSFVEFGPTAGVVRLNDKMERVKSLVKKGKAEVKDDSLMDSLEDLACYAVMLYVELKNKEDGTDKD